MLRMQLPPLQLVLLSALTILGSGAVEEERLRGPPPVSFMTTLRTKAPRLAAILSGLFLLLTTLTVWIDWRGRQGRRELDRRISVQARVLFTIALVCLCAYFALGPFVAALRWSAIGVALVLACLMAWQFYPRKPVEQDGSRV